MVVARVFLVGLLLITIRPIHGEESGTQTCVSQYAQATCMGPWFGWNEPTHLNQGKNSAFLLFLSLRT